MSEHREGTAAGLDAFAARVAAQLRTDERASVDFADRVMARMEREPAPAALPRWRRPFAMPPAALLALAAGIGFVAFVGGGAVERSRRPAIVARGSVPVRTDTLVLVRFVLPAPDAREVALVGTFNSWDERATPLTESLRPGVWTVEIPVARGRHEYAFIVDGERWTPDSTAPLNRDEFGTISSVVHVGASTSGTDVQRAS